MLTKTPAATFIRHYIEMVVVMFAGMLVLGLPGEAALKAMGSGTSELRETAPATVFLGMAFTMTAPMVAWMRRRGHAWQPTLEMAASMVIPTLVAIALLGAGVAKLGGTAAEGLQRSFARDAQHDHAGEHHDDHLDVVTDEGGSAGLDEHDGPFSIGGHIPMGGI
jgi:hypothetical protein